MRSIVISVVLFSMIGALAQTAYPPAMLGSWKLNVETAQYSPGPAPRSRMIIFTAHDQGITRTGKAVAADGAVTNPTYSANFDGKDYPISGVPGGETISLKRIDANTFDSTVKKGGNVTSVSRHVISKDGQTLTVTVTGTTADGKPLKNFGVFERQ